jgi:hypothetical protein
MSKRTPRPWKRCCGLPRETARCRSWWRVRRSASASGAPEGCEPPARSRVPKIHSVGRVRTVTRGHQPGPPRPFSIATLSLTEGRTVAAPRERPPGTRPLPYGLACSRRPPQPGKNCHSSPGVTFGVAPGALARRAGGRLEVATVSYQVKTSDTKLRSGNWFFVGADPCVRPKRPHGCAPTERKLSLLL